MREVDGAPRILDLDLAERLGFANPIDIRKLVRRHKAALAALGTVATMATVKRGQKAGEFYLNRRQAIFVTAKSETVAATEITVEIVRKFDAYERGTQPASSAPAFNVNLNDPDHLLTLSSELAHALKERNVTVQALRGGRCHPHPEGRGLVAHRRHHRRHHHHELREDGGHRTEVAGDRISPERTRWCYAAGRATPTGSGRSSPIRKSLIGGGWSTNSRNSCAPMGASARATKSI